MTHVLKPLSAFKSSPLAGSLEVPGDKSISHRALILGGLTVGQTVIGGLLEGEDVLNTARAIGALGAQVRRTGPGAWLVDGCGVGGFAEPRAVLDHGNSGTGVRLTMGAVATTPIAVTFTGDASLCARPMGRVLEPLSLFETQWLGRAEGYLPLTLKGSRAPLPVEFRMNVPSAQVKSAMLLAALNVPGETTILEAEATRDHTERMLRHFGADIRCEDAGQGVTAILVRGQRELAPAPVAVPGDPSSAAFLLVAALLVPGSRLTVKNCMLNPTRIGLLTTLCEMGARIDIAHERDQGGEIVGDVTACHSALKGVDVPAGRAPSMIDEYPILAVAASFAEGTTRMAGLNELRVKESDRLSAIAAGLKAIGVSTREGPDSLEVHGLGPDGVPGGGQIETRMDHRIAMAFLVAGLAARASVTVDDTSMIVTSFPGFVSQLSGLGAAFKEAVS